MTKAEPAADRAALLFEETQRFTQPWLWLLLIGVAVAVWLGVYQSAGPGQPGGQDSGAGYRLAPILTVVAVPVFFAVMHLRTEVRLDGLYVRFFPLHLRFRSWRYDEIESAEPRTYAPIREFGGWGIRRGRKGWAYNVRGKQGVQLTMTTGKRILIGTQQPDRLSAAIQHRMHR